jgi:hypothetical protein
MKGVCLFQVLLSGLRSIASISILFTTDIEEYVIN